VKYLVVKNPKIYKELADTIKIKTERITDLDGFYNSVTIENSELVNKFKNYISSA
jgi:hypothetical protein